MAGVSYERVGDEKGKYFKLTNFAVMDSPKEIIGPRKIKECRKGVSNTMQNDKYLDLLAGFAGSIFQDLEKYLRTEVDLVEDDIRLVI